MIKSRSLNNDIKSFTNTFYTTYNKYCCEDGIFYLFNNLMKYINDGQAEFCCNNKFSYYAPSLHAFYFWNRYRNMTFQQVKTFINSLQDDVKNFKKSVFLIWALMTPDEREDFNSKFDPKTLFMSN
jgi:hypothetical protein